MDFVYLGLFSKILNWVLDKIFAPVFKFLASLLNTVFGWIYNNIIGPIIQSVLIPLFKWVIELIFDIFAELFYKLLVAVLKIVDYMQIAFDILIGLRDVTYTSPTGKITTQPLLDTLILQPTIRRSFLIITCLALGIALLLTIYATLKSMFDLDFENKRPVSKVLTSFMKTCLNFLMIPFLVLVMIKLSGVILGGINTALAQGNMTIGTTIFLVSSLDASLDGKYNVSSSNAVPNVGFEDSLRKGYYLGTKSYANRDTVAADFDFSEFDYLVGYATSIFMMIILAVCLIQFVQRIFDILVLYLISPLFVSTMPIDEGEKFGKWREMFIAKCFMGFGAAIGMRLYLMLCPLIMGNAIDFTGGGETSTEMNYVIKLLFLIGGAWAVLKSSSMVTSLLSVQAGMQEQMSQQMVGGAFASVGMRAGRSAIGGITGGISKLASKNEGKSKDSQQRFDSRKEKLAGSGGKPGLTLKDKNAIEKADGKEQETSRLRRVAGYTGSNPEFASRGHDSSGESATKHSSAARSSSLHIGSHRDAPKIRAGQVTKLPFGLGIDRDSKGKLHASVRMGNLFTAKYNNDGSQKIKVMGFQFNRDASGKLQSYSLPGKMVERTKNQAGEFKTTRVNAGIVGFRANSPGGKLNFSDMSVIGLQRRADEKGEMHVTRLGIAGVEREKQANGEYASTSFMGVKIAHSVDENNKRSIGCVKLGNMVFGGEADLDKKKQKGGGKS